jgi:hypothetical protein
MGIKLDSPIVVRVDNIGAIFMGENISISQRTKHVDVRAKFVTEMIVEGIFKVIFFGQKTTMRTSSQRIWRRTYIKNTQ